MSDIKTMILSVLEDAGSLRRVQLVLTVCSRITPRPAFLDVEEQVWLMIDDRVLTMNTNHLIRKENA